MRTSTRLLSLIALLFLSAIPTIDAAQSATSFCKCVCAGNSTIIALNPPSSTDGKHSSLKFSRSVPALAPRNFPQPWSLKPQDEEGDSKDTTEEQEREDQKHHKPTCADCNRAFCLEQGLKICEDVKEEDVFATCFRMLFRLSQPSLVRLLLSQAIAITDWPPQQNVTPSKTNSS